MLPLCEKEGIGVMPWSPLAWGYLARPHRSFEETSRGKDEEIRKSDRIGTYRANGGPEINERVEEVADEKGVSMAQIALSWLLHQDAVDAPIIGTTSIKHLESAVEALYISLPSSDLEYLEEPYDPVTINGHV